MGSSIFFALVKSPLSFYPIHRSAIYFDICCNGELIAFAWTCLSLLVRFFFLKDYNFVWEIRFITLQKWICLVWFWNSIMSSFLIYKCWLGLFQLHYFLYHYRTIFLRESPVIKIDFESEACQHINAHRVQNYVNLFFSFMFC